MITLGVNYGIAASHDPSACLVDDRGEVLAYVEQERVSRRKHAPGEVPLDAIWHVLETSQVHREDVTDVAVGWDEPALRHRIRGDHHSAVVKDTLTDLGWEMRGNRPAVHFIEHHTAHAYSALYSSPFDDCNIVVADGNGEEQSTSIFRASRERRQVTLLESWPRAQSLGYMFEATSRWLGLGMMGAGQTMGLAAYGKSLVQPSPTETRWVDEGALLPTVLGTDPSLDYNELIQQWLVLIEDRFGPRPTVHRSELHTLPSAVAAAWQAQRSVEEALANLTSYVRRLTGIDAVAFAGGVALNCAAIGALSGDRFTPPVPHDAGVALGAAWAITPPAKSQFPWSPYLGARAGTRENETHGFRWADADPSRIADLIAGGAVGGIFTSRAEVGPRALGHRSILSSASESEVKDRLNRLKRREPWRPFGPITDDLEQGLWHDVRPLDLYMAGATTMTSRGLRDVPAGAHVDNTTRPQVVSDHVDPLVQAVLAGTRERGLPALINTSFNDHDEPIVNSADGAVRTASQLGLDFVVIGEDLGERDA